MATDGLYQRVRPKKLADVVGQDAAVKVLSGFLKRGNVPHAIMFVGPSGTGKTTLARILAIEMGCKLDSFDFTAVDCPKCEPLETVREIERNARYDTFDPKSKARVWVLDEAQSLSRANSAQQGLLSVLEDSRDSAYFFLCTTDPVKIIPTIHTRCTKISLGAIPDDEMTALIQRTAKGEGVTVKTAVVDRIVALSAGSARTAVVLLEKALTCTKWDEQLEAVEQGVESSVTDNLAKMLLFDRKAAWPNVAAVLKSLEANNAESVRLGVLGYARAVLLSKGLPRAYELIEIFRDDVQYCGHAGLAAMAYAAVKNK